MRSRLVFLKIPENRRSNSMFRPAEKVQERDTKDIGEGATCLAVRGRPLLGHEAEQCGLGRWGGVWKYSFNCFWFFRGTESRTNS